MELASKTRQVLTPVPSQASLVKARSWIAELQRQADPSIVVCLAGNKLDLAEAGQRQVSTDEAQKFADDEGLMFAEVSAKTAQGVEAMFKQIGASLSRSCAHPLSLGREADRACNRSTCTQPSACRSTRRRPSLAQAPRSPAGAASTSRRAAAAAA